MVNAFDRPGLMAGVFYRDPKSALEWLEKAFRFERHMVITDESGNLAHSEMRVGEGLITVAAEWAEFIASPMSVGGRNTQTLYVHLSEDVDAHCARAKAAGAVVLQEPTDQFYGDRTYRARDPEGHVWTFAQTVKKISREEAERASGLRIEAAEWS